MDQHEEVEGDALVGTQLDRPKQKYVVEPDGKLPSIYTVVRRKDLDRFETDLRTEVRNTLNAMDDALDHRSTMTEERVHEKFVMIAASTESFNTALTELTTAFEQFRAAAEARTWRGRWRRLRAWIVANFTRRDIPLATSDQLDLPLSEVSHGE